MEQDYSYLTYDNGYPFQWEEFLALTYKTRDRFMVWMKEQKRIEQRQLDKARGGK